MYNPEDKLIKTEDRFINFYERLFKIYDIELLTKIYRILKKNKIHLKDLIMPYLTAILNNPDLITKDIVLKNHLVIRINYKNGDTITSGFNKDDLEYMKTEFQGIVDDLQEKINNL